VPALQFISGVLSLFYFSSCPWDGTIELVYAMFWAVMTILKEPVILLCLLLVAKGWCITRNHLNRREVRIDLCKIFFDLEAFVHESIILVLPPPPPLTTPPPLPT